MQTKDRKERHVRQPLIFKANLDQISYKKGGLYHENKKVQEKINAKKDYHCGY